MNKFRRRYGPLISITICSVWGICLLADDEPASPVVEKPGAVTTPGAAGVDPFAPTATEPKLGLPPAIDEKPVANKPNWTRSIQGFDLILVETEDGLAGYSRSRDQWDRVVVGLRDDGKPRISSMTVSKAVAAGAIGNELLAFGSESGRWDRISFPEKYRGDVHLTVGVSFAAVVIGDELFGFSSQAGRWGKLEIPHVLYGKVAPTVGLNMLYADMGNRIVVLSPKTGEWTSSDEMNVAKSSQGNKPESATTVGPLPRASTTSPREQELIAEISQREQQAVNAAKKIRSLLQELGKDHPSVIASKRELMESLSVTLDLKFQHERMQVESLQTRLNQLQSQIKQRQVQRTSIVERRAQELTEGDILKWEQLDESGQTDRNRDRWPAAPAGESANKTPRFNANSESVDTLDRNQQGPAVNAAEVTSEAAEAPERTIQGQSVDSKRLADEKFLNHPDIRELRKQIDFAQRKNASGQTTGDDAVESAPRKVDPRSRRSNSAKEDDVASNLGLHDFAAKIVDAHQNLAGAKAEFEVLNNVSRAGTVSRLEFVKAQTKLERATRNWKFIHDEYSAVLQDLQLQIKAAVADANFAGRGAQKFKKLQADGVVSSEKVDEAEELCLQAEIKVDRLKIQIDLLTKAGDDLSPEKKGEAIRP